MVIEIQCPNPLSTFPAISHERPPSMSKIAPVTKVASDERRNARPAAISSGLRFERSGLVGDLGLVTHV
jgi:hypothetical protein